MDLLLVWYYGIIGCGLDDDDVRLVEEELEITYGFEGALITSDEGKEE